MTYDKKYNSDRYYWGKEPSDSAVKLLKYIQSDINNKYTLLDLGCGEGRNAIYFAQQNFEVTAIEKDITVTTTQGDVRNIILTEQFDVIFSSGTIHYLSPDVRLKQISHLQAQTKINGINAINVFVHKPFVPKAPDTEESAYLYKSGELLQYYADWKILFSEEIIFDCTSGGVAHQNAMNFIIAQKVQL